MKLFIQIPCFNEQDNVGRTIASIPRHLPGIDEVCIVVIDDGSNDDTVRLARENGADKVIRLARHHGLAEAFSAGIAYAITHDADIVVNTDADLQYPSERIQALIAPLCRGEADIAVGNRLDARPAPFPWWKMWLERFGSATVRFFSNTHVRDAASGFRAFNREAMELMYIHSSFSYTIESLLLAGMKRLRIANVPVTINTTARSSRLYNSVVGYVSRMAAIILRSFLMYHPLTFFSSVGAVFLAGAAFLGLRYLWFLYTGDSGGHVQSLILLAILAFMGFQCIVVGLLGDVIAANRRLMEDMRVSLREHAGRLPVQHDR
jgi:glycosyltransferase involved in cell wall biosynthesis